MLIKNKGATAMENTVTINNVQCFGKMSKDIEGFWVTTCDYEWTLSNLNPATNEPFSNWTSVVKFLLQDKELSSLAINDGLELSIDC